MITAEAIKTVVEAAAESATMRKGSQTPQTRKVIAAMKAIGLHRSTFSARTHIENGVYGNAMAFPQTDTASTIVVLHASVLAKAGFIVTITGADSKPMATISTTPYEGFVRDWRTHS